MIDYFAHIASLQRAKEGLAAIAPTDTTVKAASDALAQDVASEMAAATLGALVDHVVSHAASDGSELQLLSDMAALWTQGASVAYLNDKPVSSTSPDPLTDRHWAQLNLFAVVLAMDGTFNFQFWAGNPFSHRTRFELIAKQAGPTALSALSDQIGLRARAVDDVELVLSAFDLRQPKAPNKPSTKTDRHAKVKVKVKSLARQAGPEIDVRPRERKAVSIDGRLRERLASDEFTAIEIEQWAHPETGRAHLVGTLGLVLTARR